MRRRLSQSIAALTPEPLPPIARKHPEKVYFGKHPDRPTEFRGLHAMDPPIVDII